MFYTPLSVIYALNIVSLILRARVVWPVCTHTAGAGRAASGELDGPRLYKSLDLVSQPTHPHKAPELEKKNLGSLSVSAFAWKVNLVGLPFSTHCQEKRCAS